MNPHYGREIQSSYRRAMQRDRMMRRVLRWGLVALVGGCLILFATTFWIVVYGVTCGRWHY